jgi:hypothetical protein
MHQVLYISIIFSLSCLFNDKLKVVIILLKSMMIRKNENTSLHMWSQCSTYHQCWQVLKLVGRHWQKCLFFLDNLVHHLFYGDHGDLPHQTNINWQLTPIKYNRWYFTPWSILRELIRCGQMHKIWLIIASDGEFPTIKNDQSRYCVTITTM